MMMTMIVMMALASNGEANANGKVRVEVDEMSIL